MANGDWFKTIVNRKKSKKKKGKGSANQLNKVSNNGMNIEEISAIRIQFAFRRYKAKKALRHLKGLKRLKVIHEGCSVKKQTSLALSHIHSWSKIQTEIRARRACMVTEGRIKQKKQENQEKLDAKLHEVEVEWNGGSDTMDEILSRIQYREEAAVKRERAMAYAFSHQWRANAGQGQNSYEFGKGNWGWSWVERWIAARPWESRNSLQVVSPQKPQVFKIPIKMDKKTKKVSSVSSVSENGNGSDKKMVPSIATVNRRKMKQTQPEPTAQSIIV